MSAQSNSSHSDARAAICGIELVQGLSPERVVENLRLCNRMSEAGNRGLAFYLAEMAVRKLYKLTGHGSIAQFAHRLLAIPRRRCGELVMMGKKLLELPRIDAAVGEGSLAWSKALEIVRVATPDNEEAWLKHAEGRTVKELADDVRACRRGDLPRSESDGRGTPHTRLDITARVDGDTHDAFEAVRDLLQQNAGHQVTSGEVIQELLRKYGADRTPPTELVEEAPADFVEDGRTDELDPKTSKALRDEVIRQDGGRCVYTGETKDLHVHHVVYRSEGGRTVLSNLVTVSKWIHGQIHDGFIICKGTRETGFRFYDRNGRCLSDDKGDTPPEHRIPLQATRKSPDSDEPAEPYPDPTAPPEIVPAPRAPEGPDTIDGAWWKRHAELIRFHKGGVIELRPGQAKEIEEATAAKREPLPIEQALGDLVLPWRVRRLIINTATASPKKGVPFDHTLFTGPPGTGKTSLAKAIAAMIGATPHELTGLNLQDPQVLIRTLAAVESGDVIIVDEAHGMSDPVKDLLLGAMAEGKVTIGVLDGALIKEVKLALPPFTLLAATTEEKKLPRALRDRFGIRERLGLYRTTALTDVVLAIAARRGIEVDEEAASVVAFSARGTPRVAGKLLDRAYDVAICMGASRVKEAHVEEMLDTLGYDVRGLDPTQQRYMEVLKNAAGAVSLKRIAAELGLDPEIVETEVEPWLLEQGHVVVTHRGRGPRWLRLLEERVAEKGKKGSSGAL